MDEINLIWGSHAPRRRRGNWERELEREKLWVVSSMMRCYGLQVCIQVSCKAKITSVQLVTSLAPLLGNAKPLQISYHKTGS